MKCRCGAIAIDGICPNEGPGDFVRHDLVAQSVNQEGFPNWTVLAEEGGFRAYAGPDLLEPLFATEEEAWGILEDIYWGMDDGYEEEQEEEQDLA